MGCPFAQSQTRYPKEKKKPIEKTSRRLSEAMSCAMAGVLGPQEKNSAVLRSKPRLRKPNRDIELENGHLGIW
jgi:hypothetical protein